MDKDFTIGEVVHIDNMDGPKAVVMGIQPVYNKNGKRMGKLFKLSFVTGPSKWYHPSNVFPSIPIMYMDNP